MTDKNVTNLNKNSFSVDDALQEAEKEINEERIKNAKKKLKAKLQQVSDAEQILKNLKRELDELKHELANGIG